MTTAQDGGVADVPYDGEPLALGRATYIVPELPLRAVKVLARLARQIPDAAQIGDSLSGIEAFEAIAEPFADVLFASLRRNYPALERRVVDDGLTLAVFLVALPLVLRVNGFAQAAEGGSGNGEALQPISTGAPSMPA